MLLMTQSQGRRLILARKSLEGGKAGNLLLVLGMLYEDSSLRANKKSKQNLNSLVKARDV
jgi:hypothetical protein